MDEISLDVVVIGGGIAGLWTLNRLRQQGLNAILIERGELGGGQTLLSQGIIHGGAKYTLQGAVSGAANAIAAMPARWRRCLEGGGELDLSATRVLSPAHYFWTAGGLSDRMTAFFASKAMRGRTQRISKAERPQIFQDPAFRGEVYRLDELVLDVPSLVTNLVSHVAGCLFRLDTVDEIGYQGEERGRAVLDIPAHNLRLLPRHVLITAGEGYPALARQFHLEEPTMQLRPLHMAMVAHDRAADLYAHCIGTSSKPLITVTTHPGAGERKTWYLGGDLAETSNDLDPGQLITRAQRTLAELLPWVQLNNPGWRTVRVNRAEPSQPGRKRPDRSFLEQRGRFLVAWPTKLALAPDLADQVIARVSDIDAGPPLNLGLLSERLTPATIGTTPWESL